MKKQMIAFMLSLAMVVASIGGSSVLAAETNGETGITEGSAETADDGVGNDEVDDDEAAVVETTDDAAADDEAAVAETADDDDKVADDETAVVETADDEVSAILEGPEDTSEEIGPEPAEENREAVADSTSDENAVQAIWTEDNSAITFYYGPIVEEGDYFGEETVTNVWVGDDVVTSRVWFSDKRYDIKSAVFDSSFQAVSLTSMRDWFHGCCSLENVDFSGLNTSNVTDMSEMFADCGTLTSLDLSGLDTSNVTDMNSMFNWCTSLTDLDLHGLDMSSVENMADMFFECHDLTNLDLSDIDTSNVTDMSNMFYYCSDLTSLDLSSFDTSNVTDMSGMFDSCFDLTSLDLSSFDTSNVTNMNGMFCCCFKLTSLDLSGFDTSKVTDMETMFVTCYSLTSLDLSGFDTSNVTNMGSMFAKCDCLTSLDLSSFDTSNVTVCKDMFYNCYDLRTIYCADSKTQWNLDDSTDIFTGCGSLVGKDKRFVIKHSGNNDKASMARSAYLGGYFTPKHSTFVLGKTTRGDIFNLAGNVKLTWKAVPGARYYKVYREGITNPKETRKDPVIVTSRLIGWDTQPGLTNGHAYRYRIVASLTGKGDSSGDSPLSYSKVMYRLKTVCIRSVKNTDPGKVTVRYDKTVSGDSYVLRYSERDDMAGAKSKVVPGADNTSCTIGGLKKGKTYYISIRVRKKVNGIDYYTTFGVPVRITVTK